MSLARIEMLLKQHPDNRRPQVPDRGAPVEGAGVCRAHKTQEEKTPQNRARTNPSLGLKV